MIQTFAALNSKGGVGKTTLTANLGALLADMGLLVLLIDADIQLSLSKYFSLGLPQPAVGLTTVIVSGQVTAACLTPTLFRNFPHWPFNRIELTGELIPSLQGVLADKPQVEVPSP